MLLTIIRSSTALEERSDPLPPGRRAFVGEPFGLPRLVRVAVLFSVLLAMLVAGLVASYTIPQSRIVKNAKQSLSLLRSEGFYPTAFETSGLMRDDFDDAVMIDTAITGAGRSPFTSAMLGESEGIRPGESGYTFSALARTLAGRRDRPHEYSYYWHGYQILLRPALYFFSLGDIRYLNMLLMGLAGLVCVVTVHRRLGERGALALGIGLLVTGFYIVPLSLNFSADVYIMLAAMTAAVELEGRGMLDAIWWEFWFGVGMLTAFFDLFTVPMLTFAMPLVAVLLIRSRSEKISMRSALIVTATSGLLWGTGYTASWSAKWIIGSVALGQNVLLSAATVIAQRTGISVRMNPVAALYHNLRYLYPLIRTSESGGLLGGWPTVLFSILLLLIPVVWTLIAFGMNPTARLRLRRLSPALLPGVLSFAWIVVVSEHSGIHMWFTYRLFSSTVFALVAVVLMSFERDCGEVSGRRDVLPIP